MVSLLTYRDGRAAGSSSSSSRRGGGGIQAALAGSESSSSSSCKRRGRRRIDGNVVKFIADHCDALSKGYVMEAAPGTARKTMIIRPRQVNMYTHAPLVHSVYHQR